MYRRTFPGLYPSDIQGGWKRVVVVVLLLLLVLLLLAVVVVEVEVEVEAASLGVQFSALR